MRCTTEVKVAGAQSIRRALAVLRIVATGQERGMRLTDVVEQSGLNRATVHRILRVLMEERAIEQDRETRRYLVGQEISLLGLARTARFPIRAVAEPYLHKLGDELGDTVFLTIRSGLDSICVERVAGSYPIKVLSIEVGARRPLGVGVAGVMLLAALTDEEAANLVATHARRLRAHQLTPATLMERVRKARELGYAYTDAGIVRGTRAVAVPIHGPQRDVVAALSLTTITERLPASRLPVVVERMQEQAAQITRRLAAIGKRRGA
jgi:DNA-binding IclR family transcriptional regulator